MSLALFNAVLASNHTKSSTRFAQALLAYHACSRCGRVYVSVTRLANELNANLRNTKVLLGKLRKEKVIEPTGEVTPQGVVVYKLVGVSFPTPDEIMGDAGDTGGVSKACRFCRSEVSHPTPNRQEAYRHEKDVGADGWLVPEKNETKARACYTGIPDDFETDRGVVNFCRGCCTMHQAGHCLLQAGA
jgi:hypothetical protein